MGPAADAGPKKPAPVAKHLFIWVSSSAVCAVACIGVAGSTMSEPWPNTDWQNENRLWAFLESG